MPPEPLPWDRKDLLRDKKHERSDSIGSLSRWREASHHGPPSREIGRWGSSEFRSRPPGQSKQGVCNGRSSSSSRDNTNRGGSFNQKESPNNNNISPNGAVRSSNGMNGDVENIVMESSSDQYHFKEQQQQQNDIGGGGNANGLDTGRRVDIESSVDWKSHKWSRSGSLSSRGSSFSQSGSSKSMGVDSSSYEAKNEVQIIAPTPLQSPSGEAGACVTSAAPIEDPNSRKKKPRLGWGEGLAKYEKKKVEGPDDSIATKPSLFVCTTDPLDPLMLDPSEKSPVVPSAMDPATPSSVGCSSSSGREDKPFAVTSNIENETGNLCSPDAITMENLIEKIPFSLENLDLASISNLSLSLGELLQDESTNLADSSFVRCTAINKLLVLKRDVSKELEITESEIDLLETELKCESLPTVCNSPGRITTNYTESCTEADGEEDLQSLGAGFISASHVDTLLASNIDIAKKATQKLERHLPSAGPSMVAGGQNDNLMRIRDKIMERKHFLKFQERVLALKYRVFQRMWKEDMQRLSVRKNRVKAHKRQELCLRTQNGIFQRHRSSTHTRFSFPGGSASVVPSTDVINFTSTLLSDTQAKVYRNTLKMPAMILDKKERIVTRFISSNGLLEDPCGAEKERALINPWTLEERKIFVDKFAEFGKDFKRISSFLTHKTVAACVEFYYKNHKSDWFALKKENKQSSTSRNYLVTSGKQLNHERNNAASLHMLGAVSALVANADNKRLFLKEAEGKGRGFDDGNEEILDNERETAAADVLAGICGSMSTCVTSSFAHGKNHRRVLRKPLTVVVSNSGDEDDDDDSCSDESCEEEETMKGEGGWTDQEKSTFVQALSRYGKDFTKISQWIGTKSRDKCKVFFSKACKTLGLDFIHPVPMEEDETKGQIVSDLNILPRESFHAVVPKRENIESEVGISKDGQEKLQKNEEGDVENGKSKLNCLMDRDINSKQLQKKKKKTDLDHSLVQLDPVAATNSVPSHQNKTLQVIANTRNDDLEASKSSKVNGDHLQSSDKYFMQDCILQKCTTTSSAASVAELPPFPPPKQENIAVCCGGGSSSDLEKPPLRNGDIKLFGQILTHLSPNEEKKARLNGLAFERKTNGAASTLAVDAQPLNDSVRSSYCFLDENRIQSGLSCLPDSAIILAKYPSAFVNLSSSSSSNLEQHTLPRFEPKNELSSNGIVDYNHKLYSKIQQQGGSSRGEKSQQDILLTEMRMLNGYEAAPSTVQQQQPIMMMMAGGGLTMGMNMGSVPTEPMATLKMHYGGVIEQQQNGHMGTHHSKEEEPWRGNKGDDICR